MASIEKYQRTIGREEVELSELDKLILTCARDAGISLAQWSETFSAVGAEKIADFQELHQKDFDSCNFKPVLNRRIRAFQGFLLERRRPSVVVAVVRTSEKAEVNIPVEHGEEEQLQLGFQAMLVHEKCMAETISRFREVFHRHHYVRAQLPELRDTGPRDKAIESFTSAVRRLRKDGATWKFIYNGLQDGDIGMRQVWEKWIADFHHREDPHDYRQNGVHSEGISAASRFSD